MTKEKKKECFDPSFKIDIKHFKMIRLLMECKTIYLEN